MSAQSYPQKRSWLAALVAQVEDYVFEPIEEVIEPKRVELEPQPVVAVVSAAPRSGASTVARLLAAELAARGDGAAALVVPRLPRRSAPPSRATVRLQTALGGAAALQACGRVCLAEAAKQDPGDASHPPGADFAPIAAAARYLAPVVLDVPADGSGAAAAALAERVVLVAEAAGEPALLDAVAAVIGGEPLRLVNRCSDRARWAGRATFFVPDSRLAARAATLGARSPGSAGAEVAALADALGSAR